MITYEVRYDEHNNVSFMRVIVASGRTISIYSNGEVIVSIPHFDEDNYKGISLFFSDGQLRLPMLETENK